MTSKQRAYLMSLAQKEQAIIHIGKSGITPELTKAVDEALAARELVKVGIFQNCFDTSDFFKAVLIKCNCDVAILEKSFRGFIALLHSIFMFEKS